MRPATGVLPETARRYLAVSDCGQILLCPGFVHGANHFVAGTGFEFRRPDVFFQIGQLFFSNRSNPYVFPIRLDLIGTPTGSLCRSGAE